MKASLLWFLPGIKVALLLVTEKEGGGLWCKEQENWSLVINYLNFIL